MRFPIFNKRSPDSGDTFELDSGKREIRRGRRVFPLQHKAIKVLQLLRSASPRMVSRSELIEQVWDGNCFTGEKGINQALWSIRAALGDNARYPRYIETIPRCGYRWIAIEAKIHEPDDHGHWPISWRALAALPVLIFAASILGLSATDNQSSKATSIVSPDGTGRAYFRGRDIIATDAEKRIYVMKPGGTKLFGPPTYSPDGRRLAFTASTRAKCELIVVEFATKNYEKYTPCPIPS